MVQSQQTALLWCPHLGAGLQVVVEHADRDGEVSSAEGVRTVPALGAELAPLRHHRVEIAEGKEDAPELLLLAAHLQGVLQHRTAALSLSDS